MEGLSSGLASPPLIDVERQFVFSSSLLQLQLEGPFIPGSNPPCNHCKSKRVKCICEAVKQVGRSAAYAASELLAVQQRLERSREALSSIPIQEWKRHTSRMDTLKQVIPTVKQKVHDSQGHFPELLINSWTKLYEILAKTPILRPKVEQLQQQQKQPKVVKSVHLCECPGGFVAATNHFIKTQAKGLLHSWRATSLNPYFEGCSPLEALDDDGLYRHTERRWILSPDGSGDLRSRRSIEYLWKQLTRPLQPGLPPFGLADLVTADGSFDVQFDPGRQEELVAPLVYAEVVAALGLLQIHGCAVVKAYALQSHHSFSVLALLSMCFKTVAAVKPLMSRGGNSEVYLLGLDFRGIRSPLLRALTLAVDGFAADRAIIPREWLPDEFVSECVECARFFTELQAEHLDINLERFKHISSQELWQLSLEKERQAAAFIESTNLLPIRFEDRIVPDKEFVTDLEAHGFTNSTRRGSRERVQGVLAHRVRFRGLYRQLQEQRLRLWQQNGGCSRALCLLTPQAAVNALLECTYTPFERVKSTSERQRCQCFQYQHLLLLMMLLHWSCCSRLSVASLLLLQVKDGEPLWLCLYAQEASSQQQQQQQPQQQQQQQTEASDVASFFSNFTARARQGWNEHQQPEKQQQPQHQQQHKRVISVPSAAAVAWRDEVLQGLKKGEFNARPSVWLTVYKALEPHRVQMSRFADDRLMTVVMELRHQLPFLFPTTAADYLLLDALPATAASVRLRPEELPPRCCVDLLLAFKALAPPRCSEAELPGLWRQQYAVCVELSTWGSPLALPLQLTLRRFGCGCFVIVNPPLQQLQQQQQQRQVLTPETLEATSARPGPILGVTEVDVLAAFAAGEPAETLKRQIQEDVLPKLPRSQVSLVSLDVTGIQHGRLQAAAQRESEGDSRTQRNSQQPEEQQQTDAAAAEAAKWTRAACSFKGAVAAVHEEIAQAEMESGLMLLAQLIQGLMLLSPGGDLVLRFHAAYTRYTASLLLLCSVCFCSSALFKPASVSPWCTDTFFLGRERRQLETGSVLQLLFAAWNMLVAANRRDRDAADNPRSNKQEQHSTSAGSSHKEAFIDCGGLTIEWALQQCIKAKLFTELVVNRWLLSFNNALLRQQAKDLKGRLDLLSAASRAAGAAEGPLSQRARAAAAAAFHFPSPQERKRRIALFLREKGVLDLLLRKGSSYHEFLLAEGGPEKAAEGAEDEWGSVTFDSLETLCLLAGARPTLAAAAGDELWQEA
ncbi:hypothetical protein Efla_006917 [Eimeria flavescens]